jgi:hypothetical protein
MKLHRNRVRCERNVTETGFMVDATVTKYDQLWLKSDQHMFWLTKEH